MTNDKEYMREYMRYRRQKLADDDKKETQRYFDDKYYANQLKKNKIALKRYKCLKKLRYLERLVQVI